jgi:hypothetical protein
MAFNALVEDVRTLAGGSPTPQRERITNEPATESYNARFESIGPYRVDNVAASATVALSFGAVDANASAGTAVPRSGTIVGVAAQSNAVITGGTATFRPSKNTVVQGTGVAADSSVLSATAQKRVTDFADSAFVSFVAGDLLGITVVTSAGYLPITAVRWNPVS